MKVTTLPNIPTLGSPHASMVQRQAFQRVTQRLASRFNFTSRHEARQRLHRALQTLRMACRTQRSIGATREDVKGLQRHRETLERI